MAGKRFTPRDKGVASITKDEAIQRISEWGQARSTATYDHDLHFALTSLVKRLAARQASPVDPFVIPLA